MLSINTIPLAEENANEFIFMDSFETWQDNAGEGRWTYVSGATQTSIVRTGARALKIPSTGTRIAFRKLNPYQLSSHYSVGVAIYPEVGGTSSLANDVLLDLRSDYWFNGSLRTVVRSTIGLTETSALKLTLAARTTIFGEVYTIIPIAESIPSNIWTHLGLETDYSLDGNTLYFTCTVYVNERDVLTVTDYEIPTAINSIGTTFSPNFCSLVFHTGNYNLYLDDLYVKKNDFVGDLNIGVIRPDGDTDDAGFIPDTGTEGYSRVNDTLIDGDTSYIEGTAAGTRSVFTMQDIDPGIERIYAIQGSIYGEKTAGGGSQLRPIFGQEGSTDGYQSNLLLYPTAGDIRHMYYTMDKNPATGQEYTPEEINNLLYGVIKVS